MKNLITRLGSKARNVGVAVAGTLIETEKVLYLTKEFKQKTVEGEVMDDLNIRKMCCRRHFLTHVDIE